MELDNGIRPNENFQKKEFDAIRIVECRTKIYTPSVGFDGSYQEFCKRIDELNGKYDLDIKILKAKIDEIRSLKTPESTSQTEIIKGEINNLYNKRKTEINPLRKKIGWIYISINRINAESSKKLIQTASSSSLAPVAASLNSARTKKQPKMKTVLPYMWCSNGSYILTSDISALIWADSAKNSRLLDFFRKKMNKKMSTIPTPTSVITIKNLVSDAIVDASSSSSSASHPSHTVNPFSDYRADTNNNNATTEIRSQPVIDPRLLLDPKKIELMIKGKNKTITIGENYIHQSEECLMDIQKSVNALCKEHKEDNHILSMKKNSIEEMIEKLLKFSKSNNISKSYPPIRIPSGNNMTSIELPSTFDKYKEETTTNEKNNNTVNRKQIKTEPFTNQKKLEIPVSSPIKKIGPVLLNPMLTDDSVKHNELENNSDVDCLLVLKNGLLTKRIIKIINQQDPPGSNKISHKKCVKSINQKMQSININGIEKSSSTSSMWSLLFGNSEFSSNKYKTEHYSLSLSNKKMMDCMSYIISNSQTLTLNNESFPSLGKITIFRMSQITKQFLMKWNLLCEQKNSMDVSESRRILGLKNMLINEKIVDNNGIDELVVFKTRMLIKQIFTFCQI